MHQDDDTLSALIRHHASRHVAGPRLRADILARVAAEAGQRDGPAVAAAVAKDSNPSRSHPSAGWLARLREVWHQAPGLLAGSTLAGFALGLSCALLLPRWLPAPEGAPPIAALVADHVHALGPGPLFQVASSDRHTVKPWFQGRLDYAPPVRDLSAQGFLLLGGRVASLHAGATAVLVFAHQLHRLDLFLRPAMPTSAPAPVPEDRLQQWRGFRVLHGVADGMEYWAVSDMEPAELEAFDRAWTAALASR